MEFMNDSPQEKSDRYLPLGRLGEGTFGEVRMGRDAFTGKDVAMKYVRIMSKEKGGIPRAVFRELESLRQLGDCNLVTKLIDYFPEESNLCLVLEFLPSDLYEVIQRATSPLPVQQVKAFSHMLLDALSHCHSCNIIHRDIKPASMKLIIVETSVSFNCSHICVYLYTYV
jgi:serine/threonine protein kinase